MRLPSHVVAVGLALQATTVLAWGSFDGLRTTPNGVNDGDPDPEPVPSYNFSMPLDHFNSSNSRTFNNRYFVNDTYYQPGGPVIFYDFGASGIDDLSAAILLGGWNGSLSAPLELAKTRGGVVIGLEHRYYGRSMPFPVVHERDAATDPSVIGLPLGGAADYRYLTVQQAMEDVAYFARRFNQTTLGGRNTVLSTPNATQHLDPYHTPWIWVGASYGGMRGTWVRLHNPDIIHAVWSSSAPVQTVPDASAYSNPIYRALPGNCSTDMHAAAVHIDEIMDSGDQARMDDLSRQIELALGLDSAKARMSNDSDTPVSPSTKLGLWQIFQGLLGNTQSEGYSGGLQIFCDIMERFDVPSYFKSLSLDQVPKANDIFLSKPGNAKPSDAGIATSNGDRGGEAVLAAYLFAVTKYLHDYYFPHTRKTMSFGDYTMQMQDAHSWQWQVLNEIGLIVSVNASSPMKIGSKHLNHEYARQHAIDTHFSSFAPDAIPAAPDTSYPIVFGGWRMVISNTMFTNGEFDPWRAYGVASMEWYLDDYPAYGGIRRGPVPRCGELPGINVVFGTVYPGAVQGEDMVLIPGHPAGSQNVTHPPLKQGLELFQQALDIWLPCFFESRGQTVAGGPDTNLNATSNPTSSTDPDSKNAGSRALATMSHELAVVGLFLFAFHVLL